MASSPLGSHQWHHLQPEQERIWRPCLAKERNTIHARLTENIQNKKEGSIRQNIWSISQETVVRVLVQQLKAPIGNLVHCNGRESAKFRQVDEPQVVRLVDICCIEPLASICQCSSGQSPKALCDVLVTADHEHSAIHQGVGNSQACLDLIPHMQHLDKFPLLPATNPPENKQHNTHIKTLPSILLRHLGHVTSALNLAWDSTRAGVTWLTLSW